MNGHLRVEPIGWMSWKIRSCEHAWISSRPHLYEERRNDSRIDQVEMQVQDEHLEEIICLILGIYLVNMNM
jgi:hypothetical protein